MTKLFKVLGWLVSTLFVLILLAIAVLPRFFDPNDYRDELVDLVKEQTGRELSLDGDLSLSIFPWLGVSTGAVSLSQPAGFDAPDMLSVAAVDLRVKLMPLLQSKVEVATIILNEPRVHMMVMASGLTSLDGLAGEGASEQESSDDVAGAAVALAVAGVELTDGSLIFDDQQAGQRYELDDLQVVTGNLLGGGLADILISGTLIDSAQADPIEFRLESDGSINTESYSLTMAGLVINVAQGLVSAELDIGGLEFAQETGQAELSGVSATVNMLPESIEFSLPAATLDLQAQTLEVPELIVAIGDMQMAVSISGQQIINAPVFSGNLNAAEFDLQALLAGLAVDYQTNDSDAMRAVALNADYQATLNSVSLSGLVAQLDETRLEGSFSAQNFIAPQLTFDLDMNVMNIDRYLSLGVEEEDSELASLAFVLPIAGLRGLNANGSFDATSMTAGGMKLTDINVSVVTVGNTMTITPNAALYGGAIRGEIKFIDQQTEALVIVKQDIFDVDLGALLADTDVTDRLSGNGTLNIDLTVIENAAGLSNQGSIKVLARDGALKGVDIKAILDQVAELYAQNKDSEASEDVEQEPESSDETKFFELTGTFNIDDQLITNNDFLMKSPLFRMQGEGEIDLASESLNYLTTVSIVTISEGQGGKNRSDLVGLNIPVRFFGNLLAPSYKIDFGEMLKQFARSKVKEEGDKIKEKLGEEAGELLKRLFN
jgi:AsmA protein